MFICGNKPNDNWSSNRVARKNSKQAVGKTFYHGLDGAGEGHIFSWDVTVYVR